MNAAQSEYGWGTGITGVLLLTSGLAYLYVLYSPVEITPLENATVRHPANRTSPVFIDYIAPPFAKYSETQKRPLFNPDRRPFARKEVVAKPRQVQQLVQRPAPVAASSLKLLGVLIDATTKKALIGTTRDTKGLWLSETMSIEGWQVTTISVDSVTVSGFGRTQELKLYSTGSD